MQHLLGLGHRTVHHIAGPEDSTPAIVREQAWRIALQDAGAPVPEIVRGDWTADAGFAAGRKLIERRAQGESVTAVLAASDDMAVGFVHAAGEAGLGVPADISVIGFDDIPLAAHLVPPLTTVKQDFEAIGAAIVELLVDQIERGRESAETTAETDHRRRVVPASLLVRGSTAAPPSA